MLQKKKEGTTGLRIRGFYTACATKGPLHAWGKEVGHISGEIKCGDSLMRKTLQLSPCFSFFRTPEETDAPTTTNSRDGPDDERDSFTFCLLAADKKIADEYKVIKFNPCTQYEETIAHRLPYHLGCAMIALEGMFIASFN